jgi:hypothetical protein
VGPTVSAAFESLRKWSWLGALAAALFFVVIVMQLLAPRADADAEDVASAWNQSIARLGILPLYPPGEDFYVGDVWAVIADEQNAKSENSIDPTIPQKSTLIGKSVRISNIDLRSEIQTARNNQPLFGDTSERKPGVGFRKQEYLETKDQSSEGRIALTLAAFPGITISHRTKAVGSLGWSFGGLGLSREDQHIEEIRIPVAETYGAPSGAAFLRLDQWCADRKTRIFCSDEYVRRIIAYSVSDGVLSTKDGNYTTRIQLRLINRVYLTREIEHRWLLSTGSGAAAQLALDKARPTALGQSTTDTNSGTPDNLERRTGAAANAVAQSSDPANIAGTPTGKSSLVVADGRQITLQEVFQRPVVFGFRAITVDLTPSKPGKVSP